MKHIKLFVSSALAGLAICIGALAFLICENKVTGACAFSVGLFIVLRNGYSLFTGAISYVTDNGLKGVRDVIIVLFGNAVGAFISGRAISYTKLTNVVEKAKTLVAAKADDSLLSIFILAIFCNFLIYYSVDSFKNKPGEVGKYLGILLCIPVFILTCYEHCVANMCYISIAGIYNAKVFAMLGISVLGNTCGGILIYLLTKFSVSVTKKSIEPTDKK